MNEMFITIYNGLKTRWIKAGKPQHITELCLWDLSRVIDKVVQQRKPLRAVLSEAVSLLEEWIAEVKAPATADEVKALASAKTLINSGWGAGRISKDAPKLK